VAGEDKSVSSTRERSQIGSGFAHAWVLSLDAWTHACGKASVGYLAMDAIALSFAA